MGFGHLLNLRLILDGPLYVEGFLMWDPINPAWAMTLLTISGVVGLMGLWKIAELLLCVANHLHWVSP